MTPKARLAIAILTIALHGGSAAGDPSLGGFERPVTTTRDGSLNQTALRTRSAGASAVSVANSISINQSGRGNTLYLVIDQKNTGAISSGVALNGALNLE
jgi:hypothetical protein